MNSIRTSRILRTVIVAVTLLGCFVLTNHCALSRMTQGMPMKKAPSCCHRDATQPAKAPANGGPCAHCCKSVHVVMPDGVKAGETTLSVIAVLPSLLVLEARTGTVVLIASASGPPRAASFSELVLHRSLRSHAPPSLA